MIPGNATAAAAVATAAVVIVAALLVLLLISLYLLLAILKTWNVYDEHNAKQQWQICSSPLSTV